MRAGEAQYARSTPRFSPDARRETTLWVFWWWFVVGGGGGETWSWIFWLLALWLLTYTHSHTLNINL